MAFDSNDEALFQKIIEAAIRIGLLALLVAWCFDILRPFVEPTVWGIVIAVALFPIYRRLCTALGQRTRLAAGVMTLAAMALLITPTVMLSGTLVDGATTLATDLSDGSLSIPPPSDGVKEWPLVGKRLHKFWTLASTNLTQAMSQVEPQLKQLSGWVLGKAAGVGFAILQFVLSILIAGLLLAHAAGGEGTAVSIATRLTGDRGESMARLATATVRSVAQGVLGIALIQSLLAGLGLMAVGVPAAGLWALLVLLAAVIQLPPLLILGPIILYVFSVESTTVSVLFAIWSVAVSMADAVLKPLLLGRGVEVPMLVILLGAIGGMVTSGIIGLFVGSVVLALGYNLFTAWLQQRGAPDATEMPSP